MRTHSFLKFRWFAVCLALFVQQACFADDSGLTLQTGGTQITLPAGWEILNQPENFIVQKRAVNAERRIALSAGTMKSDLTLQQYVALGIYGLKQGEAEKALEQSTKLAAELAHIPTEEVQKAVQSEIGQQTVEQIKNNPICIALNF